MDLQTAQRMLANPIIREQGLEGEVKSDPEWMLKATEEIFGLATQGWSNGHRHDVIKATLALGGAPESEYPEAYEWARARGFDVPEAAQNGQPEPAPDPVREQAEDGKLEIESVFPGYDDLKVSQIIEAITEEAAAGNLSEKEFQIILAYEEANEGRKKILELKPEFKAPEPEPVPEPSPAPSQTQDIDKPQGGDLKKLYQEGKLGSERINQEVLVTPPAPPDGHFSLPVDITAISDEDLSRLTMAFHSHEARTLWLESQESGRREVCDRLASDAWADSFAREYSRLKTDAKDTASAIENARSEAKHLADVDETVRTWRNRAVNHSAEARQLKALAEGYEKAVARLSREQSRRERLAEGRIGR
jgi:hypothetical protein